MANSWANSGVDLHVPIDRKRVRESLEVGLRNAITDGRLAPGAAVPPSRALAVDLGVARNTVAEAYSQLVAEGWLVARTGSGTRVADRAPAPAPTPAAAAATKTPRYDLRAGFPDVTSFPRTEWLAAARAALAEAPADVFGYWPPVGLRQLRESLATYLGRARGVRLDAESLVICGGFTSGLHVVAGALRRMGAKRVGVEEYGHALHRAVLAHAGLTVVTLVVDEDGAVPDGLDGLDAVVLTSAHQFPIGSALSAQRRAQFAKWASRTGAVIVEDDYDGEFRYDRRALGAVQALAPEHVVYAGTASKTLAPGVRLGWLVVPERLRAEVLDQNLLGQSRGGTIEQLTLARFIDSGRYDRHVRRARLAYRRRRDRLLAGLARRAPDVRAIGTSAGLHLTLELPDRLVAEQVVHRAAGMDLAVEALAFYAADTAPHSNALVVGYATPPAHRYTTALARLFTALGQQPSLPGDGTTSARSPRSARR